MEEMITFKVPKSMFEKIFMGKPGENYEMPMTPAFQKLMEDKLDTKEIPHLTVTFEERNTILATFEIPEQN